MITDSLPEDGATSQEDAEDAERLKFAKLKGVNARTLQEICGDDKDAVYDRL